MNAIQQLHQVFKDYLSTMLDISPHITQKCSFSLNTDEMKQMFGDINSNAALILAKEINKNPHTIAQKIIDSFMHESIEKIEVAGPGFLNIFLTHKTIKQLAQELFTQKEVFFIPDHLEKIYNISLEFVSANPTGPLHFGHGRGGIIGDVLGNIFTFLGHSVIKEFYINDAGAQIQKLGNSLKIRCLQASNTNIQLPEDAYHGEYLIKVALDCFTEYGASIFEQPDSFFQDYAKQKLLAKIKNTLTEYGIQFDCFFSEKTLHESDQINHVLLVLKNKELLYIKDGALWFKSTKFGDDKDRVVQKASGELTYIAADIAYLKNKINRGHNKLIMILGHDHHSYAVRLHAVQKALDLENYPLDVILYQLVKINEDGISVSMSKRTGKLVTLNDVIETVGKDVARFFYLNRKSDAQLEFDLALALKKTEENPVYYAQYAYVRTNSILEKAATYTKLKNITKADSLLFDREEFLLLKKLISLKELLIDISNNYQTHLLTYYIVDLAQSFHRYYSKNRCIDLYNIKKSRARLLLILLIKNTFKTVLTLLGISQPEKM